MDPVSLPALLPSQTNRGWRAARLDVVALLAIAVVVVAAHLHYGRRGVGFDEASWYFHFGRRALAGALPYRDYVFHDGPLPIYVDAMVQAILGSSYTASLSAAMAITIARVFVVWMLVRRAAGLRAAALLAIWCAFDPTSAVQHASAAPYVELFVVLAGLCFVVAARRADSPAADSRPGRQAPIYFGLAGVSLGLIVTARPDAAWTTALATLVATAILVVRRAGLPRARFAALWGGFAAAIIAVFAGLAITGAAGPAFHQLFVDTPGASSHHGITTILDALTGNAFDQPYRSWWGGLLSYLAIPAAIVGAAIYATSREDKVSPSTLAVVAIGGLLLAGLYSRYAVLNWFLDLPQLLLTAVTVIALGSPDRTRRWLGVEPMIAIGLATVPLAASWALSTGLPGRGWDAATPLVTSALLLALSTRHLAQPAKIAICAALALAASVHVGKQVRTDVPPFARTDLADGTISENKSPPVNSLLAAIKVSRAKQRAIAWLTSQVPRGSTCFVYGDAPVLYDLLSCTNPTRVDLVGAASVTTAEATAAFAVLRDHPADYLVVQEHALTDPPIAVGLDGNLESALPLDQETTRVMRAGLAALLAQYESIGITGEHLGDAAKPAAAAPHDHIEALRLYRRKR